MKSELSLIYFLAFSFYVPLSWQSSYIFILHFQKAHDSFLLAFFIKFILNWFREIMLIFYPLLQGQNFTFCNLMKNYPKSWSGSFCVERCSVLQMSSHCSCMWWRVYRKVPCRRKKNVYPSTGRLKSSEKGEKRQIWIVIRKSNLR